MTFLKDKFPWLKKSHLSLAGILILILLAGSLLFFNNFTSRQSDPALVADVYFDGEYRVVDGEWMKIVEG